MIQKIYVAGNAARAFLTAKLPTTCIIDISCSYGFKYSDDLLSMTCFNNYSSRYYSLCKEKYIYAF